MKKILLFTIILFVLFTLIVILGNVIVIGEKITTVAGVPWFEYTFYIILFIVVGWLLYVALFQPMMAIHFAPEFPVLAMEDQEEGIDEQTYRDRLTAFGRKLSNNCYYLPVEQRQEHQQQLLSQLQQATNTDAVKSLLNEELKHRYGKVDKHIISYGTKVFIITAVSSSNRLDTLATLGLNYRMVADIVRASGFRPNHLQLVKIYYYVISSAFLSYFFQSATDSADDLLDGITDAEIDTLDVNVADMEIPDVDASNIDFTQYVKDLNLPGIPIAPLADGLANAVMTVAIGYITKHYLQKGSKELKGAKGRRVKLKAKMKALGQVPTLLVEIPKQMGNTGLSWAMKGFEKAYGKMAGRSDTSTSADPLDDIDAITPEEVLPTEKKSRKKGIFGFWS